MPSLLMNTGHVVKPALLLVATLITSACSLPQEDSDTSIPDVIDNPEVQQALSQGDASLIESSEIVQQAVQQVSAQLQTQQTDLLKHLYGSGSIAYAPSRHSQFLQVKELSRAFPIVIGNGGLLLAAASDKDDQRQAAFGTNILSELNAGNFPEFEQPMIKLLGWLMDRNTAGMPAQAKVAMMAVGNSTYSNGNTWITGHFDQWQVEHCTEAATLATCVSDVDLVVVSTSSTFDGATLSNQLSVLKTQKTPVLYVHQDSWNTSGLTPTVLEPMGFFMQGVGGPGNYFAEDTATWSSYRAMLDGQSKVPELTALVNRLENGGFSFDIADCEDNCSNIAAYTTEFKQPWDAIRSLINQHESKRTRLFSQPGYEFEKLLILLGDKYRQEIDYPMSADSTDTTAFLRALFANGTVYMSRGVNPVPADLGNFSRTDFSHITPANKTVSLESKRNFRSAGVYALPGQTFTVTRLDSKDVTTKIFINTQRSGSTHEWDNNGYSRPKFLQSQWVEIKSGETLSFTHPYGGPIQVGFSGNDLTTQFQFNNIGLHPYWHGAEDNESFSAALTANEYDWAELVTPGFEVHSQTAKMVASTSDERFPSTDALAAATMQYVHNYPHVLAGFQGPSIDVVDEIHQFATDHDYTINTIDMVKHMNADQATCGYGCSGNPYDAYWSFGPVAHGDIHELGHGLERGRFRFSGWDGHASTNPYSYYTKSKYYLETGNAPECQSLPFDDLLSHLQDSVQTSDPFAHMKGLGLNGWSNGVAIYIQMMMAAQHQSKLVNGWHLLARLHIYEREFERANDNDDVWNAKAQSLGLVGYTRAQANGLSTNDWLANALSWSAKLDYSGFLTMWGIEISATMKTHIQNHGFTVATEQFYGASGNDYCLGLDKDPVSIQP